MATLLAGGLLCPPSSSFINRSLHPIEPNSLVDMRHYKVTCLFVLSIFRILLEGFID